MTNYPAGSNTPSAPWNVDESEETVHCDECEQSFQDVIVSWSGKMGFALCPKCDEVIEIEPPEPDYDAMKDLRDDR